MAEDPTSLDARVTIGLCVEVIALSGDLDKPYRLEIFQHLRFKKMLYMYALRLRYSLARIS